MKQETFLKIANELEAQGIAFFNRIGEKGEHGEIRFRVSGHDHHSWSQAWLNAQRVEAEFVENKIFTSIEPDLQSSTIRMLVRNIYVKEGAK